MVHFSIFGDSHMSVLQRVYITYLVQIIYTWRAVVTRLYHAAIYIYIYLLLVCVYSPPFLHGDVRFMPDGAWPVVDGVVHGPYENLGQAASLVRLHLYLELYMCLLKVLGTHNYYKPRIPKL